MRRRDRAALALVLASTAACATAAREERAGSPKPPGRAPTLAFEQLPSPAGPDSLTPYLDVDLDGVLRMSWQERDGERTSLYFATFESGAWSDPRIIAAGTGWFVNWADFPALVSAGDGRLVAHWLERLSDETYAYGARVALSGDGGATWSEPRWLHADRSEAEHGFVSFVAAPGAGAGFEAVWLDGRDAGGGHGGAEGDMALMRRSVALDGRLGAEELLDPRVCSCCQTDAALDASGALLTVYRDRSPTEVRDIAFAHGDARGSVHDDGWEIFGCPVNGPAVATHPASGAAAVAWFTGAAEGGGAVRVSFFDADREAFGPPLEVDHGAPEGRVDAAFRADGTLLVTWMEHGDDGAEWRARAVSPTGASGPSLSLAPVSSDRRSGFLRMATRDDAAFVAWTDLTDGSRVLVGRLR